MSSKIYLFKRQNSHTSVQFGCANAFFIFCLMVAFVIDVKYNKIHVHIAKGKSLSDMTTLFS